MYTRDAGRKTPGVLASFVASGALALGLFATSTSAAEPAGVAVIRSGVWSVGEPLRDGAGEFQVFISVAQQQRNHHAVGVVGIGSRHGLFSEGGEHALRFVALRGVAVAKLASDSDWAGDPEGLFLNAGKLSDQEAAAVLTRCLEKFGPPPTVANSDAPTPRELEAIRQHLLPFREAFLLASAPRLAVR